MSTKTPRPMHLMRPWYYLAGCALGGLALVLLSSPSADGYHAAGPANPGHADIGCDDCHRPSLGTARQQLQAKIARLVGRRDNGADFVHRRVTTRDCQACHARDDDRHPVYRFEEPRFREARNKLGANRCTGCHVEHSGHRVDTTVDFCETCHEEIQLKEDPVDPTHAELAKAGQWDSCLKCHDFHGNHAYKPPSEVSEGLSEDSVLNYLREGPSPYGTVTIEASSTRKDLAE